jgi:hypothetical protein
MTEPPTEFSHRSPDGTMARTTEPVETVDNDPAHESPSGTPRWVKAFGIVLVVLLLAFAALHLSGNAPTHMGIGDGQHGIQLP